MIKCIRDKGANLALGRFNLVTQGGCGYQRRNLLGYIQELNDPNTLIVYPSLSHSDEHEVKMVRTAIRAATKHWNGMKVLWATNSSNVVKAAFIEAQKNNAEGIVHLLDYDTGSAAWEVLDLYKDGYAGTSLVRLAVSLYKEEMAL